MQAGLGWGGSCFGKDTAALVATAREYSVCMRIVQAARDVNYEQHEKVVAMLLSELKSADWSLVVAKCLLRGCNRDHS